MRRKNLWLRLSSCTMAALLATTSITPAYASDFSSEITVESQQEEAGTEESEEVAVDGEDFQAQEETSTAEETEAVVEDAAGEAEVFSDEENAAAVEETFSDEAGEEASFEFGTAKTKLEKGTYTVKASLMNASNIANASMAGSCIAGDATVTVDENGNAKATVPVQAVTVYGMTGNAEQWKVYKSDLKSDTTAAEYTTDANGKVNSITFTIPDKTADGAYVNMYVDLMSSTVDAFLKLDYANAVKQAPAVDTTALEATVAKADTLNEMAYTKASWDGNKDAIETAKTAAKTALEAKESQEAVDAANTALTEALAKLVEAGDATELKETLTAAKALNENDYTVKSWENVAQYITDAETAIANRETQTKLRRTNSSLKLWIGKLVEKYSTEKLEEKITEAEGLKKEDYTADSWKAANIANAINAAQETIAARGDKDAVHAAIQGIERAIDKLVAVSNEITVGRGNFQKKLTPGTYSIPLELLNGGRSDATNQYTSANYMSQVSMAAGCFTDNATLVIHEDGTATLTTGVQAISAMGLSGAASDWTIYENTQDYLDGKANSATGARFKAHVDASKVQAGKKKPSQISFTIPDLKQNVVATNMYIEVMSVNQDACIGLDWANVEKVSDDTTATSTVEKEYVVKADIMTQLANMKAGTTVKLDQDVTLTEDISLRGGTLDLNGHTLVQADNLIMIKGDVTIIDSSAEKTGKITREKYSASSDTTTSISVEKGSLTVEGVTIDGQIGNKVHFGDSMVQRDIPKVTVKLTNCTLLNTVDCSSYIGGDKNVAFAYVNNGVEIVVDGCTADKGIYASNGTGENTTVTNSTVGSLYLYGEKAIVTNVTATAYSELGAAETTVKDDNFAGVDIGSTGDVTLENINSKASERRKGALTVSGSGVVTVKNGVFENEKGYAVVSNGYPLALEGGYFKGASGSVNGAYTTSEGKILGDVTEGEYAGYQTVVDGTDPEVEDPVATVYNTDGTVAKQIPADKADLALSYAKNGQTVKLNQDLTVGSLSFYKDCILDLNGHVITEEEGINGNGGTCRVIDSSTVKTGKIMGSYYVFNGNVTTSVMILDNVMAEASFAQGISVGTLYITNGTKMNNVVMFNAAMGGGITYVQDSTCTIAETDLTGSPIDGKALIEGSVRTSQYTITEAGNRTYTVTANDLGKAMRAFEAVDSSLYTKASYEAAVAIYKEMDESADEDVTADIATQKAKELNDAVAALEAAASQAEIDALKETVSAAKAVKGSDYTSASYKTLTNAISAAEKLLSGEDIGQAQVQAASQAIKDAKAKLVKASSQKITVTSKFSKKYGDKAFSLGAKAKGKLTYKSSNTKVATVDSKGKVTVKGVGSATITVNAAATDTYKAASTKVTVKVSKGTPSIKTKTSSKTLKVSVLKKKAQKISLGASVNSKGKLSFKKVSGNKAIAVSSKTGALTVKKGLKKGTYKVKIQITSKAAGNYNGGKKTVTVTVRVK